MLWDSEFQFFVSLQLYSFFAAVEAQTVVFFDVLEAANAVPAGEYAAEILGTVSALYLHVDAAEDKINIKITLPQIETYLKIILEYR